LRYFRIGTGSIGGTYFPIGGLIASIVSNPPGSRDCDVGGSCGVPGLIAVAQSTDGSIANVAGVLTGTLEAGLCQADIAYWAFTGGGPLAGDGPRPELRALGALYPEDLHIVVRADSDISVIQDLRGRRVAIGARGSGSSADAELLLGAFGLSLAEVEPVYLEPGAAVDEIRANQLDALIFVGGYPLAAISDLAREVAIRLLPIAGDAAAILQRDNPFFIASVLPAEVYPAVPNTPTLSVESLLIVADSMEESLAYGVVSALWHESSRALLDRGHPSGRLIRLDTALTGVPIPLHPGAERYYRERELMP
jgi:TRAP transporter TAXI family solute receptor